MEATIFFIFIIFAAIVIIPVILLTNHYHEKKITEKIEEYMDGKLINFERRGFFSGLGPFKTVGKNQAVYRVEYHNRNGYRKAIWVRFGGWFGPEWREE